MHALLRELYPICRSITGNGFRHTLARLARDIPMDVHEVPSGTAVFDWTVPREWNIRDAYVKDSSGRRVIDFQRNSLHVVSYSIPVHGRMSLALLRPHLHTLPEQPDLIPYRTSYYEDSWGFCLAHREAQQLCEGEYEVCIDSTLEPGHLTFGECLLKGASDQEVLVSAHACHPSLANDNLSGVVVAAFLARQLAAVSRRYSYRFLFIPGTIGSITWLSLNEQRARSIRHGLVLTCIGDRGKFTYKRTRRGNATIDVAVDQVLKHSGQPYSVVDFSPYGYDERQYCSPGFNLPVGCLMRSPHGEFPEYHTSADNPGLVDADALEDAVRTIRSVFDVLEHDRTYRNTNPMCEPQLGRRGLYVAMGETQTKQLQMAMLWVLNLSDGGWSLLDIAQRSDIPFKVVNEAAQLLADRGLLEPLAAEGALACVARD
jgi:aminopeptidase-like protein